MKISKIIAGLTMVCFAFAGSVSAQSWEQGKVVATVGYGFPNLGKSFLTALQSNSNSNGGSTGDLKVTGFGPLHVKGEYAVSDKIGIGLSVNFVQYGGKWSNTESTTDGMGNTITKTYNYDADITSISFNPRLNVHFATTDKVDPYWGIGAGYKTTTYKLKTDDPDGGGSTKNLIPIGFETTVGCRFYFTENIGAYTELGFSKSIIQAGIVAKF